MVSAPNIQEEECNTEIAWAFWTAHARTRLSGSSPGSRCSSPTTGVNGEIESHGQEKLPSSWGGGREDQRLDGPGRFPSVENSDRHFGIENLFFRG